MNNIVHVSPRHIDAVTSQADIDDSHWKYATTQGNTAFENGQFNLARQHYRLALFEALSLLSNVRNRTYKDSPMPAPILVISASNIANTWSCLDDPQHGLLELQQAIVHLADVLQDVTAPINLRDSCAQNLPRAIQELMRIRQECEQPAKSTEDMVETIQGLVFEYMQSASTSN